MAREEESNRGELTAGAWPKEPRLTLRRIEVICPLNIKNDLGARLGYRHSLIKRLGGSISTNVVVRPCCEHNWYVNQRRNLNISAWVHRHRSRNTVRLRVWTLGTDQRGHPTHRVAVHTDAAEVGIGQCWVQGRILFACLDRGQLVLRIAGETFDYWAAISSNDDKSITSHEFKSSLIVGVSELSSSSNAMRKRKEGKLLTVAISVNNVPGIWATQA